MINKNLFILIIVVLASIQIASAYNLSYYLVPGKNISMTGKYSIVNISLLCDNGNRCYNLSNMNVSGGSGSGFTSSDNQTIIAYVDLNDSAQRTLINTANSTITSALSTKQEQVSAFNLLNISTWWGTITGFYSITNFTANIADRLPEFWNKNNDSVYFAELLQTNLTNGAVIGKQTDINTNVSMKSYVDSVDATKLQNNSPDVTFKNVSVVSLRLSFTNLTDPGPIACPTANTFTTYVNYSTHTQTCTGITDIYLLNTGDTGTGLYNLGSLVVGSVNATYGNFSKDLVTLGNIQIGNGNPVLNISVSGSEINFNATVKGKNLNASTNLFLPSLPSLSNLGTDSSGQVQAGTADPSAADDWNDINNSRDLHNSSDVKFNSLNITGGNLTMQSNNFITFAFGNFTQTWNGTCFISRNLVSLQNVTIC